MPDRIGEGLQNLFKWVRLPSWPQKLAAVVEQEDTIDLRSIAVRRVGSAPTRGTNENSLDRLFL